MQHPYTGLPARSFWRTAVAEADPAEAGDLWTPKFGIGQDEPVITAGSCFARHIGPALLQEGMHWYDAEPAPAGLTREQRQARGYGSFSFRTGNIHTAAALRQWFAWALTEERPPDEVWHDEDGRCHDPYRPTVEPDGYASPEEVLLARQATLAAIRRALSEAGVLVFTLGLTEAWQDTVHGTVLPMCPGTVRGTFDPSRHVLVNHTAAQAHDDLAAAVALARAANPGLKTVLTVSPVPLTATATGRHALVATTYSKSVLRAAAGQLADRLDHVDYFPSYEIVTGHPYRAASYESNLRTVSADGVAFVMRHFFQALHGRTSPRQPAARSQPTVIGEDQSCDDASLDYYNPGPVPPAG
ncbi:GSCFA domain-containing protein [Streptomyces sp. NBC_01176]|uniref:GSCFA domain-containing protein n=1 Tax=Streptomyces sp. NBC_01176 TaxID=2903760 RepID=UPI002F909B49|nr:GSCFA domain-containing protein [Streptomyces sp. NBC_01176]